MRTLRIWLPFLLGLVTAIVLWGCSESGPRKGPPVRRDIAWGDRQVDWALVYYQSWYRDRNAHYLRLARQNMAGAIRTYFDIQVRIGHSYPDFYDVDFKRRQSCRYLSQIDRDASKYRVDLEDSARTGCLR